MGENLAKNLAKLFEMGQKWLSRANVRGRFSNRAARSKVWAAELEVGEISISPDFRCQPRPLRDEY